MSSLRGYAQIAQMKQSDPDIADLLGKIDAIADTVVSQIQFTRAYQELGVKAPAWFLLGEVVAMTGNQLTRFSDDCGEVEIFTDPLLERVFYNIFDNAARHGEHVTEIVVHCSRNDNGLVVVVEDNGIGIPPDLKEKIFEKGFGKNTGYGLFLSREILSITGISIRETGVPGQGARFEILVPNGAYRVSTPDTRQTPGP